MIDGWIGVDLDGTLVLHPEGGLLPLGKPVPAMVKRVKRALALGIEVRIMTARMSDPDRREQAKHVAAIDEFCVEQFGRKLPVTCRKDYSMVELWDDRAVQVVTDTGHFVGGSRFDELLEQAYTSSDASSGASRSGSEG